MTSQRSGYVALLGRPNVGKSTLINALVGERVAIVTHKPQTTRHRITGIVNRVQGQAVFVDTPGLHRRRDHALNRRLNRIAADTRQGVDLVVMMVDATRWTDEDRRVLEMVEQLDGPKMLAFNKIDLLDDRTKLLEKTAELSSEVDFDAVVYLSAEKSKGLDDLLEEVFRHLPEAEPVFDPDLFTDKPERFLVAELIREQLMLQLHQEIPYGTTVVIERFERTAKRVEIDALILVASDRHKGMVIGKGGQVLKRVGTRARHRIADLLDERVHLELHVKTRADWMDDEAALDELGYRRDT
ncbi:MULTISPECIES: GTPase Era [unclassified Wenzhouxiangella]|uniref:GTPase Era n=1 Tax=unclassified Wenzhouxiangella TaxID=2613841 RepID=UPI000E326E09|nr:MULTISPECIES: GTPase Era [unclassified Wenzhouxiangella]RFF26405.1 GTPase Era [Wenzhouxiangella sp. 15181]RFP67322.1 GTPase Era [Wenzhouxiangella sp. 15190]